MGTNVIKGTDKISRASALIGLIAESSQRRHFNRLRWGRKVSQLAEAFVAEEARIANARHSEDPAHLSWEKIAQALEMPKSTVFRRYGQQEVSEEIMDEPEELSELEELKAELKKTQESLAYLQNLVLSASETGPTNDRNFKGWEVWNILNNWAKR